MTYQEPFLVTFTMYVTEQSEMHITYKGFKGKVTLIKRKTVDKFKITKQQKIFLNIYKAIHNEILNMEIISTI